MRTKPWSLLLPVLCWLLAPGCNLGCAHPSSDFYGSLDDDTGDDDTGDDDTGDDDTGDDDTGDDDTGDDDTGDDDTGDDDSSPSSPCEEFFGESGVAVSPGGAGRCTNPYEWTIGSIGGLEVLSHDSSSFNHSIGDLFAPENSQCEDVISSSALDLVLVVLPPANTGSLAICVESEGPNSDMVIARFHPGLDAGNPCDGAELYGDACADDNAGVSEQLTIGGLGGDGEPVYLIVADNHGSGHFRSVYLRAVP